MSRILTLQVEGVKLGTAGRGFYLNTPPVRTEIGGWLASSIRCNNDFFREVDYKQLSEYGIAFTGTVLDCPATSDDWHRMLKAFWMCLKRMGCVLIHWVIEWQQRGVLYLHCLLFFDELDRMVSIKIRDHWLVFTAKWNSKPMV